jgi:hypothetical protein
MPETPITFDGVLVIETTEITFRCLVEDKEVVIGNLQPLKGTTVRVKGDRGRLVLPRWAVRDLGLTEPTSK